MQSTTSRPPDATMQEARELDRQLNATTDPAEMRTLISRRRLVRASLDFDQAMRDFEAENPVPAFIPDRLILIVPSR